MHVAHLKFRFLKITKKLLIVSFRNRRYLNPFFRIEIVLIFHRYDVSSDVFLTFQDVGTLTGDTQLLIVVLLLSESTP